MSGDHLIIAVAGTLAVSLFGLAFVQIKRAFPTKGNSLIGQVVLHTIGATIASVIAGFEPVMWTMMLASVAVVCFIAGKGSVAVLIHETDGETGDPRPMPDITARARKRFGVIFTVSLVAWGAGSLALWPSLTSGWN